MLNLKKRTETKPKPKATLLRTAYMCVRMIVHNCRTQYSAEHGNFPLILQTIIVAQTSGLAPRPV